MTADHLHPMLDNEHDSELLSQAASMLAHWTILREVLDGMRLGRLTALRKPDGGVRVIVVADTMRRLVARTMAKQVAKKAEEATAPFQYALTTKAGCVCVVHIQERNDGGVAQDGTRRSDLPLRMVLLRQPVKVFVGG